MANNSQQNKRIIFPADNASITLGLLEKYGLLETREELAKKIARDEETNGSKIASFLIKVAKGEMVFEELAPVLEETFFVSPEIAQKLSQELKEKILDLVKVEGRTTKNTPVPKPPKLSKQKTKDIYREPIS